MDDEAIPSDPSTVTARSFIARLTEAGLLEPDVPQDITPAALEPVGYHPDGELPDSYFINALTDECNEMSVTSVNRNQRLNDAALKLGGLIHLSRGMLTPEIITDHLTAAARQASPLADHALSDAEIAATIRSGVHAGEVKIRHVEVRQYDDNVEEVDAAAINGAVVTEDAPAAEKKDLHEIAVRRKAYDLRVGDEARIMWSAQRAALLGQTPPPVTNLLDMLAIPDEPATYRVDDLWPVGGRVLLAAQYKAGKTSLVANLLRCLIDGDAFLGQWQALLASSVTLIDTELDERMLRRWLRDQNINKAEAINVVSLRGRLSTFNLIDDTTRAEWAERLRGTEVLMLDCLRPCLDALNLSEGTEAGQFLIAFDALCREAGIDEALVVHHMGHSQERSRGDSRLLDWPDVLWKIVRDSDDEGNAIEDGDRFFSAMGRDVNVPEAQLDWTPETRSLMVCGGGRADKRARNTMVDIAEILGDPANHDGLSQNALVRKLKGFGNTRDGARRAVAIAIEDGVLVTVEGHNNSRIHILNPSRQQ